MIKCPCGREHKFNREKLAKILDYYIVSGSLGSTDNVDALIDSIIANDKEIVEVVK